MACLNIENIILWSKNKAVDEWTVTASTSAASHPATEIQNSSPGLTWRSSTGAASWIRGQQISAGVQMRSTKKRGVVIVNHNLTTSGTFQVQLWNTVGTLMYNTILDARNYKVFDSDFEGLIDEIRPYKNFVVYIPSSIPTFTMGEWRITCLDSLSYYEIGRVFVGEAFQPRQNFVVMGAGQGPIDKTRVSESYGGNKFSDNRPQKRFSDISFPAAMSNLEDIPDWLYISNVNGRRTPVFIDPYPQTIHPPDFVAGEEVRASFNLIWQLYGRMTSDIDIRWDSANAAEMRGRLVVEEEL